jgi:hypothetical protein
MSRTEEENMPSPAVAVDWVTDGERSLDELRRGYVILGLTDDGELGEVRATRNGALKGLCPGEGVACLNLLPLSRKLPETVRTTP